MVKINVENYNKLIAVDLNQPQYDQKVYSGRFKHFLYSTSPFNLLLSTDELNKAKKIVEAHRRGKLRDEFSPEDINNMSVASLWKFKEQYDSAFHPQTGELQPWWGRMSSQVPVNMTITGAMIALSHTPALNTFWQLANQTYNAAVNYTNRSGGDSAGVQNLAVAWAIASSGAIFASTQAQKFINKSAFFQSRNPAIVRAVAPFTGIALANLINIPIMRNQELRDGILIVDDANNIITSCTNLTIPALSKVIAGRLVIAACCVLLPSQMMKFIGKIPQVNKALSCPRKGKAVDLVLTSISVGVCLAFSVPMALAIWPQKVEIDVCDLPEKARKDVVERVPGLETVFYNKGL